MRLVILISLLIACAAGFGGFVVYQTQQAEVQTRARHLTGGDPERGKIYARELGCVACHVMPGVRGPESHVAPALKGFGLRTYVAGAVENTADNVQRFIRDPRSVAPRSAMPKLPMSESQARDLAAYLYTQR